MIDICLERESIRKHEIDNKGFGIVKEKYTSWLFSIRVVTGNVYNAGIL